MGGTRGQTELGALLGWGGGVGSGGSLEGEECPERRRGSKAIVRGKVVGKMPVIVSRCPPPPLVMSLRCGRKTH